MNLRICGLGGRRMPRRGVSVTAVAFAIAAVACAPEPEEATEISLAGVDSVLVELGGEPTAILQRGQRWRMISSTGAGLPPPIFKAEDLPEPRSRGAGLLQVYCIQCHWLPAPQMHSAAEWPILLRRMEMRARTLEHRMGGPLTEGLTGEILMAGYTRTALPSPAERDTIAAYLIRHALRAATPGELGRGPAAALFLEHCSICHEAPSPKAHTAAGWEAVVERMEAAAPLMGVPPLADAQIDSIVAYLSRRAARAE
jgi:mono/diheme cytochrome c family protein